MATERHTVGETASKPTTETTMRLQEIPTPTGNSRTVEKEDTRMLIFGQRKENIKTMGSKTYLWDPRYVEKFRKRKMKKILNNSWEKAARRHISHIRRETRQMLKNTRSMSQWEMDRRRSAI